MKAFLNAKDRRNHHGDHHRPSSPYDPLPGKGHPPSMTHYRQMKRVISCSCSYNRIMDISQRACLMQRARNYLQRYVPSGCEEQQDETSY